MRLFENLRYIVLDELHTYRGVFGSHLANVLWRLHRERSETVIEVLREVLTSHPLPCKTLGTRLWEALKQAKPWGEDQISHGELG